jgi:hypothetical protein
MACSQEQKREATRLGKDGSQALQYLSGSPGLLLSISTPGRALKAWDGPSAPLRGRSGEG